MRGQGYEATLPPLGSAASTLFALMWAPKAVGIVYPLYPHMGPPYDWDYIDTLISSPLLEPPRW